MTREPSDEAAREWPTLSVEESTVEVVAYDSRWPRFYSEEATALAAVFGDRARATEHFGSTSVVGMDAKPIIDILIGSTDGLPPTRPELEALDALGYAFLGEDGRRAGRWFWRKRGAVNFNLSLVRFESDLWRDNLLIRDHLASHPEEVRRYCAVKRGAARASPDSLRGYQDEKRSFMEGLRERARRVRGRS